VTNTPGTVSKILWHFTGGPAWNDREERQDRRRKPASAAYDALLSILNSRQIRLGSYSEVVKVRVRGRVYDPAKRAARWQTLMTTIRSAPVCCLADIPITHLSYHARRYGKFAIGFHRNAVIKHGFNPVLYTLRASQVISRIHEGFAHVEYLDFDDFRAAADEFPEFSRDASIGPGLDSMAESIEAVRDSIRHLLSFVKTFNRREFATIYSEREWRSDQAYCFTASDIAMVVVPRREARVPFFWRLNDALRYQIDLGQDIPVVPWEDLVES
jgi:hypothetical protein